jgi:hypothetical protein
MEPFKAPRYLYGLIALIFQSVLLAYTEVTQIQSYTHVTTDGQPTSLSWCQAPIYGPKPHFCYCQTVAGLLIRDALSGERTGLSFTIATDPCQQSFSVPSPAGLMTIF